jgi:DNA-binding NarL/FixJ family response regulator
LTPREAELLELLTEGLSNKEIAQKMSISAGTVRNHLANVFQKLHVRCRTEAVVKHLRIRREGTGAGPIGGDRQPGGV